MGEKRTGPALNPLKGSSARLPPPRLRTAPSSPLLIRLFPTHSTLFPSKKNPTPRKITCPKRRLLVSGKVVSEQPRNVAIRDTFMHWSHHRGQLTVYLRLVGAPAAAIYGPSADDTTFA